MNARDLRELWLGAVSRSLLSTSLLLITIILSETLCSRALAETLQASEESIKESIKESTKEKIIGKWRGAGVSLSLHPEGVAELKHAPLSPQPNPQPSSSSVKLRLNKLKQLESASSPDPTSTLQQLGIWWEAQVRGERHLCLYFDLVAHCALVQREGSSLWVRVGRATLKLTIDEPPNHLTSSSSPKEN